jgi:serine/threonine protein kinase
MSGISLPFPIAPNAFLHNKYAPVHKIGSGSFGEVWLANDQAVGHSFAIKLLNPGVMVVEQLREAQIGHIFTHNNLVKVHQADVLTDGRVVIAMEYLPDGPITTLANPANFLALPDALRAIIDVLQGLEHLHTSNFFQNDIKPENILRGPQGQAKLGDYGIVGISADGRPVPAPATYILHAAPETVMGNGIEARTDIFQTGLTLYRLLVGLGTLRAKLTAMGRSNYEAALASGKLITDTDYPPYVPRTVVRIIKKAIHPDPAQRYQSALEMRRALEKLSFPGHWTVDANGALIGADARYTYRIERLAAPGSSGSVAAYKKNISSGRETKVSQFTNKNLTSTEMNKLAALFMAAVIEGKVA